MAANRIRVAKDKATLVKDLIVSDNKTAPFQTYADVIAFAAALGAKFNKRSPLGEISQQEPAPIGQEHFLSKSYDVLIKLIAIMDSREIKILSYNEEFDTMRTHLFEEYANGGLEIMREELRGAVDYTERLALFLISERFRKKSEQVSFDLTKFL
ncbi:DNA phosphorothioation-associated protein 4 [Aliterella atlantica]|uniref:Dnd system-associated protein 4 n=1 Tax=Aliterella atlantica CENA595 TaxID=1618023 RepID=A0A0D9A0W8_9CYAN|nr:DNA phosphorothioation-associated protein 4 [Aliterella atlantica]KJH73126.1 dnd system-associated protein 4 [Aliterella atlantica CENA595]